MHIGSCLSKCSALEEGAPFRVAKKWAGKFLRESVAPPPLHGSRLVRQTTAPLNQIRRIWCTFAEGESRFAPQKEGRFALDDWLRLVAKPGSIYPQSVEKLSGFAIMLNNLI